MAARILTGGPNVVQVVPLTWTLRPSGAEVVAQSDSDNGLSATSAAQCQHIRSVATTRATRRVGNVGAILLAQIRQTLAADVDALVNTVNTAGVMGKGIALQFRRAFPAMYEDYRRATAAGEVRIGRMHIWPTGSLTGPRYVINFPTKRHWRSGSKLADIRSGLADLVRVVRDLDVRSIAVPPLGCGNGGLEWSAVGPLITDAFRDVPDVDVHVYPPGSTPRARDMVAGGTPPTLTIGRAALIATVARYQAIALIVSRVEVQKLMYFLQVAGQPLRLTFVAGRYGPYADNLRHVLIAMEGHYTSGFGDGSSAVLEAEPIDLLPGAVEAASGRLATDSLTRERTDKVLALASGFESMYGMELLASVHWVAQPPTDGALDADQAWTMIKAWTPRKASLFTAEHVAAAWNALAERGWLPQSDVSSSRQRN